tara:strand:- start:729 stop:953 length:225 start_codon:yes stop_codon:yes gene_type:complete
MIKNYSNNKNLNYEKKNKNNLSQNQSINHRRVVDINKLLNRVKVDKKKELKKNLILFSLLTLLASFIVAFYIII